MAVRRKTQSREKRRYFTRVLRLPTELRLRLDELCTASGALYSQAVVQYWRTIRRSSGKQKRLPDGTYTPLRAHRKTVFLSNAQMQKVFPSDQGSLLHSHSCDAVVDKLFEAMSSTRVRRAGDDLTAQYPRRRKRWGSVTFKSSAIRIRDGHLLLSTGDRKRPFSLPWTDTCGEISDLP